MFAIIAAITFSGAFVLAVGTIAWMFAQYHEKMAAALLFRPIPDAPPVYNVRISRPRGGRATPERVSVTCNGALAA
ncbi:hypothetical protein WG907_07425 [Sphingobium sp. AN558]|uniref:hypothetical protein n=1 Tax=Sphingobium sp. AN558 TaxID=3133442 RepID=UPI0030BF30EE